MSDPELWVKVRAAYARYREAEQDKDYKTAGVWYAVYAQLRDDALEAEKRSDDA